MLNHSDYMKLALQEAEKAFQVGEVPIGAVLVMEGKVIAAAHDLRETLKDAGAHAEMLALREGAQKIGDWRLNKATLYVTVEPCPMCAGAIVQYRVSHLVYGAANAKSGSIDSILDIVKQPRFNHQVDVIAGIMEEECKAILRAFFKKLRRDG